ncbi:Spore protein SP21 [Candidatus Entotheonellaceae bacterium PAL068K]
MAEQTIAVPETQQGRESREHTRAPERYVTPVVDIYEVPDGLVVLADVPGVGKEDMEVRVENDLLTIRGHAKHMIPGDAVYREYELVHFFRQFELSDTVDQSRITAEVTHGVLTLKLPKVETVKPRKIEVQVN